MFHLRSLLTLSPNILALVTNSRGLPFISTGSKFGGDFEKQILNSLLLASLSSKSFDRDCTDRLSIASFTWLWSPLGTTSRTVMTDGNSCCGSCN